MKTLIARLGLTAHYRFSTESGLEMGRHIGELAVLRFGER